MPKMGRTVRPYWMSCPTMPLTMSMGIANPTPVLAPTPLGLAIAVLMPMSFP